MRFPTPSAAVKLTRRELLRALTALAAWLPFPWLTMTAREAQAQSNRLPSALVPLLDTLLPGDGGPSASQAGVDTALVSLAQKDRYLAQIIVLGCQWLDQQAKVQGATDFAALDEAGRINVVLKAEREEGNPVPGLMLRMVLDHAYKAYYSNPATWPALGYNGPPQPVGFPGHDAPVAKSGP